jgi:hypothetical protein
MTRQESQIERVNGELTELESQFSDLTKKKIELLQRKIAALDLLLDERDRAIEEMRVLRGLIKEPESHAQERESVRSAVNVVSGEFAKMSVSGAVEAVLRRERKPLTTRELVDRVQAGGRPLYRKNPASHISGSIRDKTDVFYIVRDGGKSRWGLREWDNEHETGRGKASG